MPGSHRDPLAQFADHQLDVCERRRRPGLIARQGPLYLTPIPTGVDICSTERSMVSMSLTYTRGLLHHYLLVIITMLGLVDVAAQPPGEFLQVIRFGTPFDLADTKFIHEGVRDQDPTADVWIGLSGQNVLVRASVALDRDELQQVVGQAGLQITYLGPPGHAIERSDADGAVRAPEYLDTGDPALDNARYEAAMRGFIASHPDLFQQRSTDPER